jgi:hypothetical protein
MPCERTSAMRRCSNPDTEAPSPSRDSDWCGVLRPVRFSLGSRTRAAAVASFLGDQLGAAGCILTEEGAEEHLARSRWAVPFGEEDDRGWLLVSRVPGTARVTLEVRVESAAMGDERWLPRFESSTTVRPAPQR